MEFLSNEGSFSIEGGLTSSIDQREDLTKHARFGDKAYLYETAEKRSSIGWIPVLTEGELLVLAEDLTPRGTIHTNMQAICELEQIEEGIFVARMNPNQGHRIGMLHSIPILSTIGSLITFKGKVLECKIDGWYLGKTCLTPFDPKKLNKRAELYLTEAHDLEAAYLLTSKVIDRIAKDPKGIPR